MSKRTDEFSPEQRAQGDRIKGVARKNELGLKELHSAMLKYPGVTQNQDSFELALNGRVARKFTQIINAAVEVLVDKQDERENGSDRSTQQELSLKKRALRRYFLEGEDDERYELHELDPRIKEAAMARLEQEAAKTGWKLFRYDFGAGLANPEFNRTLLLAPPRIDVDRKEQEWLAYDYWNPDISGVVISAARRLSPDLSNDQKIRVASDFVGKASVVLQPTRYFSSLATDQIAWSRLSTCKTRSDGTPEHILWDGTSAFIDQRDGRIKGFDQCTVSNQLSASVMAFTQDGEMLVVHQHKRNHQSGGRLAPSGSGSLDWKDVEEAGDQADLFKIARIGAKRELEEECMLVDSQGEHPDIDCDVLLTGFVRMVHRAGKPEFFGIARIKGNANEITGGRPERYVERVTSAPIETANWSRLPSPQIARMCQSYLEYHLGGKLPPLSYPLQHILNHLIEMCEDPETGAAIDKFMAG